MIKIDKKTKAIYKEIELGIFPVDVSFYFLKTDNIDDLLQIDEEFIRVHNQNKKNDNPISVNARTMVIQNKGIILFFNEYDLGTFVHESVHCADFIMEGLCLECMEIRAYLSEFIFNECLKVADYWHRKNLKIKKGK